jgi:hypothetical protein
MDNDTYYSHAQAIVRYSDNIEMEKNFPDDTSAAADAAAHVEAFPSTAVVAEKAAASAVAVVPLFDDDDAEKKAAAAAAVDDDNHYSNN